MSLSPWHSVNLGRRLRAFRFALHPLALLLLILFGVYLHLQDGRALKPQFHPDFISYTLTWEATSLAEALSSVRTFGYPLFLGLFGDPAGKFAAIPEIHLLVQFAAVLILWAAVRVYSNSGGGLLHQIDPDANRRQH